MDMEAPPHAHLPWPKAGYLSCNLIHLALHQVLSFCLLPIVALQGLNQSLISHISQVKCLPTWICSLPPLMGPPAWVQWPKLCCWNDHRCHHSHWWLQCAMLLQCGKVTCPPLTICQHEKDHQWRIVHDCYAHVVVEYLVCSKLYHYCCSILYENENKQVEMKREREKMLQ